MKPSYSRRRFIRTGAVAAAPMVVPASVLGQGDKTPPNSRIQIGCIGVGGMGTGNLRAFLGQDRTEVVAVCDVDRNHRESALREAKLDADRGYLDFRKLLGRDDLDAVMIATPDHWHAIITSAAVRAGLDVYCEKPLAASIGEGRFVSDLVRKEKRVLQCGTWRRSGVHTRKACELVRNGYIGDLKEIEVGVPGEFMIRGGFTGLEKDESVPEHLDYEMWLGPAVGAPYSAGRCHFNFRWINAYAPGYITDWGAHFLDVAQWGNGTDDTGPVEVSAQDIKRREKGYYDAPESFRIVYRYANGVRMTMFSTTDREKWGTRFVGSKGWVFTENTKLRTSPESLLREKIKDDEIHLYVSNNHHVNFLDCVVSRKDCASSVESAHRAASACHIGAISAALGQPLEFDPVKERFSGNDKANALLSRKLRKPWSLQG